MENNYCWNLTPSLLSKNISAGNLASLFLSKSKTIIDGNFTQCFESGSRQAKTGHQNKKKERNFKYFLFEESERPL
jgi:hypothetical protein